MSRVLKRNAATAGAAVHSLLSAWGAARTGAEAADLVAIDPEHAALRAECESLKLQLAQQEAQLSDLRTQAKSVFEQGEAKGRDAGLREAADGEALRLERLEAGIEQAVGGFRQAMDGLERLAPALAQEGLAGILGASDERAQRVMDVIRHQLTIVEARSVIHVEVSAADFTDDEALAALEGMLGAQGPMVHASVALKSGDCRIKLKLGTLEVGLDQQWGRLGALLQDMAEPAGRIA